MVNTVKLLGLAASVTFTSKYSSTPGTSGGMRVLRLASSSGRRSSIPSSPASSDRVVPLGRFSGEVQSGGDATASDDEAAAERPTEAASGSRRRRRRSLRLTSSSFEVSWSTRAMLFGSRD